jgi:hypothetical protein
MNKVLRWGAILLGSVLLWSAVSENVNVWPVRNTIDYHLAQSWWNLAGKPERSRTGSILARITDEKGKPIEQAVALVSEWDGKVYAQRTDSLGMCRISGVPAGFYRLAASAPGFEPAQSDGLVRGLTVRPNKTVSASLQLTRQQPRAISPLPKPQLLDAQPLVCSSPVPGTAVRETVKFINGDFEELLFLYRPEQSDGQIFPLLLTVYPGPVDTWECVSIGLAQAGYAVLAVGPAYGMDLTRDVDQMERLLDLVKSGRLTGVDSSRMAALGGSYSALILEQLMLRDTGLEAVVLLGPPTDMFDFRRRFEREGFFPPFGLDRALIALGLPNRDPLRYLKNSMVYHVRSGLPAMLMFHSYQDEIVPYQQSSLLAQSLGSFGIETELHLFDGASHYLLEDGSASMKIYRQTLNFLRRKGMPPLPGKGY